MSEKAKSKVKNNSGGGNAVYVFGLIGAAIYFVQQADGFWQIVLAFLQAIIWPVLVVYKLLESLY